MTTMSENVVRRMKLKDYQVRRVVSTVFPEPAGARGTGA
jgi:hypothetical protein